MTVPEIEDGAREFLGTLLWQIMAVAFEHATAYVIAKWLQRFQQRAADATFAAKRKHRHPQPACRAFFCLLDTRCAERDTVVIETGFRRAGP